MRSAVSTGASIETEHFPTVIEGEPVEAGQCA